MKIAFFWTGDFSKNILSSLITCSDIEIACVVSQPDKPVGRKQILEATPVHAFAMESGLDILQPKSLKAPQDPPQAPLVRGEVVLHEYLKTLDLDFIIVVAYGKIIPKEILDIPKYGCINVHGSILPAYRWASPIQESIKNGDTETGVTIMYMSEWMDEGDILAIEKINIDILDTTPDIFKKFESISLEVLYNTLQWVISGDITGQKQDELQVSYCSKIEKSDGEISFLTQTTAEIYNRYRAYITWPGIYSYYGEKKIGFEVCKLSFEETSPPAPLLQERGANPWEVVQINKKTVWIVCADKNILIIKQVKLEWKKSMDILSFINGNKEFLDYRFK